MWSMRRVATGVTGLLAVGLAWMSTTAEAENVRTYPLYAGKALRLTIPDGWQEKVESPGPNPPITVEFTPPSGDRWVFMLSALFNPMDPEAFDKKMVRRTVKESAKRVLPESSEKKIEPVEIEGPEAIGWYIRATDAKETLGPGDYRYMVQGMVTHGLAGMTFTLLTNDDDDALIQSALDVVRGSQVISMPPQTSGDGDAEYILKLPGKSWGVSVSIPGFRVEREETHKDGSVSMMMASNRETGVTLSMFLELEDDRPSAVQCRARYFDRALGSDAAKSQIKRWETEDLALGQCLIDRVGGLRLGQMHVNAYRSIDDVCLDLHLSKVRFKEEERSHFETIIQSLRVVPLEGATSP